VTPERLRAIETLFHQAREQPPAERDAFLARACADDPALRREVESLLAQPRGALDAPVGALVADLAADGLLTGRRLGVFEVQGLLGVGGMGEVYRARDTRLGRAVAIKILPPAFKDNDDRLARFEREARVLASLNHPHIGAIYGVEDADDVSALVMELVEGENLATRLAHGAMPVDEALGIATQIAEALEAAHEQGVVHRDLKPANITVRTDGTVKVLDFGLAKALDSSGSARSNPAASPTIAVYTTQAGVLFGTAAYMPPEQAKGKSVDKRADLWAFGCVLFEMLSGRRPFEGETISDVLAKVIERDPDWTALPGTTPPAIQKLVRRCLEKDPRRRLDSAAVARLEIEDTLAAPASGVPGRVVSRGERWPPGALVSIGALAAIVGAIVTWAVMRPARAPAPAVSRFAITLPSTESLAFSINDRDVTLSADGTRIVYVAGDRAQLMVRALDKLEATPVPGVENARAPFLSPDGRWIGFFERLDEGVTTGPVGRGVLKKVSTSGGPPVVICTVNGGSRGASWAADDTIVFATSDRSTGILRVAASGGEPEGLTKPEQAQRERAHAFPSMLPGGRGVLFTIVLPDDPVDRQIAVLDLKTGEQKTLIRSGGQAEYIDSGHLIYIVGGALWAVRFDLRTLNVLGDAVPLTERVLTLGAADFAISRSGALVYVPVSVGEARSLVWVTRQGAEQPIAAPPRAYIGARLSPDDTRAALQIHDQKNEIWTWQFARETLMRLSFSPTTSLGSSFPVWTPDGRHVIFGSGRDAPMFTRPYWHAADGSGGDQLLGSGSRPTRPVSISPDGNRLVLESSTPSAGYDLVVLRLNGKPQMAPLLETPFDERNAAISPDGRWMAFDSNESGLSRIYVRPFPNVSDARYQVSNGSGRTPAWSRHGDELFFVDRTSVMAVAVRTTPTFSAGSPVKLFDAPGLVLDGRFSRLAFAGNTNRTYDVARDGRFLMIKSQAGASDGNAPRDSMVVVENWIEEVKARVLATGR